MVNFTLYILTTIFKNIAMLIGKTKQNKKQNHLLQWDKCHESKSTGCDKNMGGMGKASRRRQYLSPEG